jgi:hypothetical protein
MHYNIYDVIYSEYSHQQVLANNLATFRVMFLLQEYNCG